MGASGNAPATARSFMSSNQPVSRLTDPEYLRNEQYADAANLHARLQLHQRFSTNPYNWFRWVFDHLDLPDSPRILEIGCGSGELWVKNADRLPTGWGVILSDFSAGMANEAQCNIKTIPHPFRLSILDAQAIPFPGETFEAVIANHILPHVPNLGKAISEIYRILKPNAYLYAATNGKTHLRELYELINQFEPSILSSSQTLPFNLENGREHLRKLFPKVEMDVYEDSLRVTEAEPLGAYILSMMTVDINREQEARLHQFLASELKRQGVIHISKKPGLFMARKY